MYRLSQRSTPVNTPSDTPLGTPSDTPRDTPDDTPRGTPRGTPDGTPVATPVATPSSTPRGGASGAFFDTCNTVVPTKRTERTRILTPVEKREAILSDPHFGMLSMVRFFAREEKYGYVLLPLSLLIGQWLMFFAVASHNFMEAKRCGSRSLTMKTLFVGVCLVYFVESIQLIDNLTRRFHYTTAKASYSVMVDRLHEDTYTLCVFVSNLVIIFYTEELIEAVFNCLAMQFLSQLENEWQQAYYETRLKEAARVFDTFFVTSSENTKKLKKRKRRSVLFRVVYTITEVIFKATTVAYWLLPVYSLAMLGCGVMCV